MPMLSDLFAFLNVWQAPINAWRVFPLPAKKPWKFAKKTHALTMNWTLQKEIGWKPKSDQNVQISTIKCYQLANCLIMHDDAGIDWWHLTWMRVRMQFSSK